MSSTISLDEFVAQHGLSMAAESAVSNPNMSGDAAWNRDASHWLCTISNVAGATMAVPFSQGSAHTAPPTLDAVLGCLASDASRVANAEDWIEFAEEMGMADSADSLRQARATFETIREQSINLRELLGDDAFETLLWNTERL
jgi:hypothetical protein